MQTSDLDPNTLRILQRMTAPQPSHERLTGAAIDPSTIDGLALGDLWTTAHATETHKNHRPLQTLAAETASMIRALGQDRDPVFRGQACRDYLEHLAVEAEKEPEAERGSFNMSWPLRHACFALIRCVDLTFEGLGPAAEHVLAATPWRVMPHVAVALARLVDASCVARVLHGLAADLVASPLLVDEVRAVAEYDLPTLLVLADVASPHPIDGGSSAPGLPDRLSGFPEYAAFARAGLTTAAERVRQIHALERPYAADKAFTLDEAAVLARLARVALDRDEPWLPAVLDELFCRASLAPTAAKTVPSQSVSFVLGHAIEAFPTPEAVASLRKVLRDVRHAGVAKKLQRNLRGSEVGLAARPGVALRLLSDRPMSKPELGTLTRCLEAGFATSVSHPFEDWQARLAQHPQAGALMRSLVWRMSDRSGMHTDILPVLDRKRLVLRNVAGAAVEPAEDGRLMLWHPTNASADARSAWRDRMAHLGIKQPFKQVFREHYVVSADDLAKNEITMFSDHEVSIRPFLGLARREGWRLEYEQFARVIGGRTATIDLSQPIFPGAVGWMKVRRVQVCTRGRRRYEPAPLEEVPGVMLSEMLRSVDLLVSASSFAISPGGAEDDDRQRDMQLRRLAQLPLGPMAEMRRDALARALAGRDGMGGLTFDARHLRLGRYAIHLATGRVTRDGDPVEVELPARPRIGAVPWLPYDERLLETIALTALQLGQAEAS